MVDIIRLAQQNPASQIALRQQSIQQRQQAHEQINQQRLVAQAQQQAQQQNQQPQDTSASDFNRAVRVFLGIENAGKGFKDIPLSIRNQAQNYVNSNPSLANFNANLYKGAGSFAGNITDVSPTFAPQSQGVKIPESTYKINAPNQKQNFFSLQPSNEIQAQNLAKQLRISPNLARKVITDVQRGKSPITKQNVETFRQTNLAKSVPTQLKFTSPSNQISSQPDSLGGGQKQTLLERLQTQISKANVRESGQRQFEQGSTYNQLFSQGNLPGVVRKSARDVGNLFVKGTGEVIAKVSGNKKFKVPSELAQSAGNILGEGLLFGGFGSFETTAQVQSKLAPNIIGFKGTTKQIDEGKTLTNLFFTTDKGKVGFATGVSQEGIGSVGVGSLGRTRVNLLTGQKEFVPENIFIGSQKSATLLDEESGLFKQISAGKVLTANERNAEVNKFISQSFGKTKNQVSFSVGKTATDTGKEVFSFGGTSPKKLPSNILKKGSIPPIRFGKTLEQTFKPQEELQSIVRASIPKESVSLLPISLRASSTILNIKPSSAIQKPQVKARLDLLNIPSSKNKQGTLTNLGFGSASSSQSKSKQVQVPRLKFIQSPIQPTIQMEETAQVPRFKLLERLVSLSRSRQEQRQENTLFNPQPRSVPFVPPSKTIVSKKGVSIKYNPSTKDYSVSVRRFGEDILIASGLSLSEAKSVLKSELQSTLRASGKILETKTKNPVFADLGKTFKPSKKDVFRVVQQRGYRLSSRGEKRAIREARNKGVFGLKAKTSKTKTTFGFSKKRGSVWF